jgi:hypothetical protein
MYCKDELINSLLKESLKVQNTVIDKLEVNKRLSDELIEILTKRHSEINTELTEVKNELFSLKRTHEIIKTLN